jgi:eukaryotic-like serine/threonine-protein kinase
MSSIALALAGDVSQASRLADDLAKRFPQDTIVHYNYLPTNYAAAALKGGSPAKAIAALTPAAPYELGSSAMTANFALYLVYLRGKAYSALHQSSPAIAEFQKILDHPGVVANEPIGALAHLGLARAHALAGDTAKARTAYQDFLGLWKDADPDIPILKEAKAEYTKLQ